MAQSHRRSIYYIIVLFFLGFFSHLLGQESLTWSRTYDFNEPYHCYFIHQTLDNQFLILGEKESGLLLMKIDEKGDTLWTRFYDFGDLANIPCSMQMTMDGGYILCGFAQSFRSGRPDLTWLIRTDPKGDTLWTKTYSESFGQSAQQTTDGGYAIAGFRPDNETPPEYLGFLMKTDQSGQILWIKTDSTFSRYESVLQTNDGGYILSAFDENWNKWIIRTDSSGDTIWTKSFGNLNYPLAYLNQIVKTADDNFIVCGTLESEDENRIIWIEKFDENGTTVWTKTYGDGTGRAIQITNDGGLIILARDGNGILLHKTDTNGDIIWTENYDTLTIPLDKIGGSYPKDVKQTSDGGYIILGGVHDTIANDAYSFLIRTDTNGNVIYTSVRENQNCTNIKVYPNPVRDLLSIEIYGNSLYSYVITSLNGQVLFYQEMEGTSNQLNLSSFPKGVYFITIRSEDFVTTRKIIKL